MTRASIRTAVDRRKIRRSPAAHHHRQGEGLPALRRGQRAAAGRHHLVRRARRPVQHVRQRRHRGRRLRAEVPARRDKLLDRTAEGAEELELDLTPGALDKTNDPVRMYLREMGTVPLLTREGEVEIAKRIERGKLAVIKSISRTPTDRASRSSRSATQLHDRRAHHPRAGDLQRRRDHRRAASTSARSRC